MSTMIGATLASLINQVSVAELSKINPRMSVMMQSSGGMGFLQPGRLSQFNPKRNTTNPMLEALPYSAASKSSNSKSKKQSEGNTGSMSSFEQLASGSSSEDEIGSSQGSESLKSKSTASRSDYSAKYTDGTTGSESRRTAASGTTGTDSDEDAPLATIQNSISHPQARFQSGTSGDEEVPLAVVFGKTARPLSARYNDGGDRNSSNYSSGTPSGKERASGMARPISFDSSLLTTDKRNNLHNKTYPAKPEKSQKQQNASLESSDDEGSLSEESA